MDLLVSGRFRKVSGSLSGSLHVFLQHHRSSGRCLEACPEASCFFVWLSAIPEDSGRFPEACPEACLNILIYCIPEASGRFPEDLREGVQNTKFCFWVCKWHKLTTFKVAPGSKRIGVSRSKRCRPQQGKQETFRSLEPHPSQRHTATTSSRRLTCHKKVTRFHGSYRTLAGRFPEADKEFVVQARRLCLFFDLLHSLLQRSFLECCLCSDLHIK